MAGAIVKASVDTPGGLYTFNLLDDGLGNPDIQAEDGVYSGIFIPPADGPYSPSVQVLSDASSRVALTNQGGVSSRLLPIEQNEFGCGPGRCDAITFTEKVSRAEAVPSFTVMNFAAYPGRVSVSTSIPQILYSDVELIFRVVRNGSSTLRHKKVKQLQTSSISY